MEIFTTGFAGKTAAEFFETLKDLQVRLLVDVRLNNVSQLAGFTKRIDLEYFLQELVGARYEHETMLAPTAELLKAYRKKEKSWEEYEREFLELMAERQVEKAIPPERFKERTVLLCSENKPDQCHRRLVVEYLNREWGDVGLQAVHL